MPRTILISQVTSNLYRKRILFIFIIVCISGLITSNINIIILTQNHINYPIINSSSTEPVIYSILSTNTAASVSSTLILLVIITSAGIILYEKKTTFNTATILGNAFCLVISATIAVILFSLSPLINLTNLSTASGMSVELTLMSLIFFLAARYYPPRFAAITLILTAYCYNSNIDLYISIQNLFIEPIPSNICYINHVNILILTGILCLISKKIKNAKWL